MGRSAVLSSSVVSHGLIERREIEMGCFDYTCAITNVSIRHNDPVLHVVVTNKHKEDLEDIISFIGKARKTQHL